jgi:hypothetical protein
MESEVYMNQGIVVAALGVLAIVVGGAMVALQYHRTIGLGALGLGVILLAGGAFLALRMKGKASLQVQPASKPT